MSDLFQPVVSADKLNPDFIRIQQSPICNGSKALISDIFESFLDKDGNFIEQFQTTGFDARLFELYLFACLTDCSYRLCEAHQKPDFHILSNMNLEQLPEFFIEAVTANPRQGDGLQLGSMNKPTTSEAIDSEEISEVASKYLSIYLSRPIRAKLKKKYHNLSYVQGKPLAISVACFSEQSSLSMNVNSLIPFLYGAKTSLINLLGDSYQSDFVELGGRRVKSGFFYEQDSEFISAIIFSNQATSGKFTRMAQQNERYTNPDLITQYTGYSFNPQTGKNEQFQKLVNSTNEPEKWGHGIWVLHNPNALFPFPEGFLPGIIEIKLYGQETRIIYQSTFNPVLSITSNIFAAN